MKPTTQVIQELVSTSDCEALASVRDPEDFVGWLLPQTVKRFAGRQLTQRMRDQMQSFVNMLCDLATQRWDLPPEGRFEFKVSLEKHQSSGGWPRPYGLRFVDGSPCYLYAVSDAACEAVARYVAAVNTQLPTLRDATSVVYRRIEWNEDDGNVLWWKFPIVEPPYVGTPLCDGFPDYVTHWTRFTVPESPAPAEEHVFELVFRLAVELGEVELWPDGDMPEDPNAEDVERLVAKDGGPGSVLDLWDLLHANKDKVTVRVTKVGRR